MLNHGYSIELDRRHDGSPFASGRIRIIGETTTASLPYREHSSRNGTLYLEATQGPLTRTQLQWISELLEVEEAHVGRMRRAFSKAARSLLIEPDALDAVPETGLRR